MTDENRNLTQEEDQNLYEEEDQSAAVNQDEEKRRKRKRRRRRNQIIAFAFVLIVLIAIVAGAGFAFWKIMNRNAGEDEKIMESVEQVKEILAQEEPLVLAEEEEVLPEQEEGPTQEDLLEIYVDELIAEMPLEDKVAGLFLVTPEAITGVNTATQAGSGTQEALEKYAVGGLIYFAKNIVSADQLTELIKNTVSYARYPLFIGVDEEGGNVSRVAGAGLADKMDSASRIAETGDPTNAYTAGSTIGAYLSDFGFNLDFAPVADLANVEGSIMEARSYGADAGTAIPYVTAMVEGLTSQGITACLKHFPGLGSTTEDTHDVLAVSKRTAQEFRSEEFSVFLAGMEAGAQMVMVGHMAAESLTGDENTPCCLSAAVVTDILRGELGFEGIIITDALNMDAVSDYYSSEEAAITALKAGCDMLLMPEDFTAAYEGVLAAVEQGVVSEERVNDSLRRIYKVKYADMTFE